MIDIILSTKNFLKTSVLANDYHLNKCNGKKSPPKVMDEASLFRTPGPCCECRGDVFWRHSGQKHHRSEKRGFLKRLTVLWSSVNMP